jgi:hypothetical protein
MPRRIKRVGHGEHVELTGHLDELRSRVLVSLAAFGTALGLCFWQNNLILSVVNIPLDGKQLITLGVAEPFTTTLTLSAYTGILLALPVVLYQAYAFILPAFSRGEKKVALPLMLMVPVLFVGGAAFAFTVVVPAALQFLLHFNENQFQTPRDVGGRGVRVNLVSAGPVETPAAGGIPGFERLAEDWQRGAPLGWDSEDPAPVAGTVAFLLSPLSRAVTGEIIHVDGGYHAIGAPLR